MRLTLLATGLAMVLTGAAPAHGRSLADAADAAGPRFFVTGEQRVRYETLSGQYRNGGSGSDQALALRTLVKARLEAGRVRFVAEAIDARVYFDDAGSPRDVSQVDTLDLLQAYAHVEFGRDEESGWRGSVKAGRFTQDLGRRRLVARNGFRNTINAFTGFVIEARAPGGAAAIAFATTPVERRPNDAAAIAGNEPALDRENGETLFYGVYGSTPAPWGFAEAYLIGIDEGDQGKFETRNRRHRTVGFRAGRAPARGAWDFEIEAAHQSGRVRASADPQDVFDLDHDAHFEHAELGYTLDRAFAPRFVVQFDHASGDRDPGDLKSGRFDTLFGARGFEFAPTGVYGPISRSNLITPGARTYLEPSEEVSILLAYRAFFLARARDEWLSAGLIDPTGESGRFLGHHIEFGLKWAPRRGLAIDAGAALLNEGRFRRDAPGAPGEGAALYSYVQATASF